MASDFDELASNLQYDLALAGDQGLSFSEIEERIHNYYTLKNGSNRAQVATAPNDLPFSEEPPTTATIVTNAFVESIWDMLSKLKHVSTQNEDTTSATGPQLVKRLVASRDQIWHAVAGHGIDNTRIKGAQFVLLHIIAKHGVSGITQPELVRESGQDKRSVPSRTDSLAKRGYITKEAVISHKAKTSLLRLTKFVETEKAANDDLQPTYDRIVYYDRWFDGTIRLLKANNNVIGLEDLRAELSIVKSHTTVKALARCIRRLETSGCVRRIRAKVAGKDDDDRGSFIRCIQLLREPTDADRKLFTIKPADTTPSTKKGRQPKQATNANEDDDEVDDEDENDEDIGIDNSIDLAQSKPRLVPQWTPDLPLSNFVFDLVDHAGVAGISIMDLHKQGVGPVWRRPIDDELIRLCDKWQKSQPPHLKHLSIIKDTAVVEKFTYFKYRTIANFEQAVKDGDAFWEAVKDKSKKQSAHTVPALDAHGFPVLSKTLFAGARDGSATLEQCVREVIGKGGSGRRYDFGRANDVVASTGQATTATASVRKATTKRKASDSLQTPSKLRRVSSQIPIIEFRLEMHPDVEGFGFTATPTRQDQPTSALLVGSTSTSSQAAAGTLRIDTVEKSLVFVNDEHAIKMRDETTASEARRSKSLIVAFRLPRLHSLPWYNRIEAATAIESSLRTGNMARGHDAELIHASVTAISNGSVASPAIESTLGQVENMDIDAHGGALIGMSTSRNGHPAIDHDLQQSYSHHDHQTTTPNLGNDVKLLSQPPSKPARINRADDNSIGAPDNRDHQHNNMREAPMPVTPMSQSIEKHSTASFTPPVLADLEKSSTRYPKKPGLTRASGTVMVRRTQVVMDILRKCHGLYPGNREIYHPVSAALKRLHGTIADSSTIDNTIKDLLARGKLRKMVFTFHDTKGMQVQRAIITDPSISPGDPRVADMQQKIISAHPARYHPPEAELPVELRAGLDSKLVNRRVAEPKSDTGDYKLNTGANDVNFPLIDEVIVHRTAAGLDLEEDYRTELRLKNEANRTPIQLKSGKLIRHNSTRGSDDDISEPEPEQLERMTDFQTTNYLHDDSHAFVCRKPRARTSTRAKARIFFSTPKTITSKHDAGVFAPKLNSHSKSVTQGFSSDTLTEEMRSRSVTLMMDPQLQPHVASGTIGSPAVVPEPRQDNNMDNVMESAISYDMYHNTFAGSRPPLPVLAPAPDRSRPVTRLQTLGSSLYNNKYMANGLLREQNKQITATTRLLAPAAAKRGHSVSESDEEHDVQPKKKPKVYKSIRGAKAALGVEENGLRPGASIEAVENVAQRTGPSFALVKKRDRKGPSMFKEIGRLADAVALYRVILGGLDQRNNWGVIAHMMGFRYEADFLRRRWDNVKNAKEPTVKATMERVYEHFLADYENGEIPTIDFTNLSDTDWPGILQWFEDKIALLDKPRPPTVRTLPSSLSKFKATFSVTEAVQFWEHSKEAWFTSPIEKMRKDLAHEFVFGVALPGHHRPANVYRDDKLVVKSLVRAIATTKAENYVASEAAAKLGAFSDDLVGLACDEMVVSKSLRHMNKGRQQPGRNFEIHDAHWALFRRWPGKTIEWRYVRDIARARQSLLRRFLTTDRVYLDFHAGEAEFIVLTNMADQGLIKMSSELPERNNDFEAPFPKLSAFGYSGYSYNAKTLEREKLRFPIVFERSSKFSVEHGLVGGVPIPVGPHTGSSVDDGRIPFWVDIHGHPLPDIWDLVLRSILHLLVFRTSTTVAAIEESHGHKFLAWEINLAIEWMEKSGIAVRCGSGRVIDGVWHGGWKASEWWYCTFEPEMTFWKV